MLSCKSIELERPWSQSLFIAPFLPQRKSSWDSVSHLVNLCAPMLVPTGVVLALVNA